jgi:hypothetical protein
MKHINSFEEYKVYYTNNEIIPENDYGFYCDMERYNLRDFIPIYVRSKELAKKEKENTDNNDGNGDDNNNVKGKIYVMFFKHPLIYCVERLFAFSFIIGNCLHLFAQGTINRVGFLTERIRIH